MIRNVLVGIVVAAALALALSDTSLAGIQAWKIVLALVGLGLIVLAGPKRHRE